MAEAVNKTEQVAQVGESNKRNMIVFFLVAVAIIVLYQIPYGWYALYPLRLFFTYVHEMGHGLTAMLVGGDFVDFKMWANGSGVASSYTPDSSISKALVSAGGLLGPAFLSAILFIFARFQRFSKKFMGFFAVLCALSGVFYVRNLFGIFFVALLCLFLGFIAYKAKASIAQIVLIVLAIGLCTSTVAESDYLFMDYAQTDAGLLPSDTQQISNHLILPYWFWGGVVGLISIAILILGVYAFFKSKKPSTMEQS